MAGAALVNMVQRVRALVMGSQGWARFWIAFLSGSLSVLAFAPVFAFPVLFVTLPVFVWLIDSSQNWRRAAAAGWAFGFGYFFFNLFWIGEAFLVEAEKFALLLPFSVTLLPMGIAIFWGAAAAVARCFWLPGIARVFVLASVLGAAEWLRGHVLTGLPWNVIGYALTYPVSLMQGASVFGVYALTPIAVAIFATPFALLADAGAGNSQRAIFNAGAVALVPITLLLAYGNWRLANAPPQYVSNVMLRLVQPSVPQREKWQPQKQREIFDQHLAMSRTDPSGKKDDLAGITHVVWPEAAMPFLPLETPEALKEIAAMLPNGTTLISGALRREAGPDKQIKGYNSLLAFDSEARLVATYDKAHLVPFGEYLPIEPLLSALGFRKLTQGLGSFAAGPLPRPVMTIPGLPPATALICYEVLFPGQVTNSSQGAQLLVNVTNDGWFGDTTGPRQHFHQARVRAVEEGLPVIRVANNGISAVIDGYGRVDARLELNIKNVADSRLPEAAPRTLYARFGDMLNLILIVLFGLATRLRSIRPKD